jgi:hypothetical protein
MSQNNIRGLIEQTHTNAIFNTLIKTQHQILTAELAKIEKLNQIIDQQTQDKEAKHKLRLSYY